MPTCFSYFSRDGIESHADVCAENWVEAVGERPVLVNLSEEQYSENYYTEEISLMDDIENIPEL